MVTYVTKDKKGNEIKVSVSPAAYCAMFRDEMTNIEGIRGFTDDIKILPKGTIKKLIGKELKEEEVHFLD